jgi:hypothetical protein
VQGEKRSEVFGALNGEYERKSQWAVAAWLLWLMGLCSRGIVLGLGEA